MVDTFQLTCLIFIYYYVCAICLRLEAIYSNDWYLVHIDQFVIYLLIHRITMRGVYQWNILSYKILYYWVVIQSLFSLVVAVTEWWKKMQHTQAVPHKYAADKCINYSAFLPSNKVASQPDSKCTVALYQSSAQRLATTFLVCKISENA